MENGRFWSFSIFLHFMDWGDSFLGWGWFLGWNESLVGLGWAVGLDFL
jgi:hypothetical protein